MKSKKEIDISIGERLSQFLDVIGMSTNSLSKITGISQSTLSRMNKNPDRVLYRNIKVLAEAFGVSTIEFQDSNYVIPNKKLLLNNLERFAKTKNKDVNIKLLLEGSNTAYYLDKYIKEGFLDKYKSMAEIRAEIKIEYGVEMSGPQLSKLLRKREEWKRVIRRPGEKKGTFAYKKIVSN